MSDCRLTIRLNNYENKIDVDKSQTNHEHKSKHLLYISIPYALLRPIKRFNESNALFVFLIIYKASTFVCREQSC